MNNDLEKNAYVLNYCFERPVRTRFGNRHFEILIHWYDQDTYNSCDTSE